MATILVVDDEPGVREYLAEALSDDGHSVVQAPDALTAVGLIRARPFDLMLTDLKMPGQIDGLGLVREARRTRPGMRVIMLTAHGTVAVAVEALKLGAMDFLEKPIESPSALRTMVRRALVDGRRHQYTPPEPAAGRGDGIRDLAEDVERALGPNYTVEGTIGRGGYAAVFRVHDRILDRDLAAKALYARLANSPAIAEQFRVEARTAARLRHPCIVPVLFVGTEEDIPCLVMPLINGETLSARLRREGPLSLPDALHIAKDIASALDWAHATGVIHRDVKPENIMLEQESGRSLLTDFGIATLAGEEAETGPSGAAGTPLYAAPEQIAGLGPYDARTDVYSFGVVVSEMLRDRDREAGWAVLRRALSASPGERYPSAGEFIRALEEACAGGRGRGLLRRWRKAV